MSTVERSEDLAPATSITTRDRRQVSSLLALVGGLLLLAIGAGLVAAHVNVWTLDETVIEQSAVHYSSNLPHSLFHDLNARATDRLYPLLLSVAFRLGNAAAAIRFDHVLSVLLFLSAAVPIYLLARRLLRSPGAAVAVALLSVALPWLTLTTALFTENLSYPLFWWAILAASSALSRPKLVYDALVLVAIGLLVVTRIQFAGVFVGYFFAVITIMILRWRLTPPRPAIAPILRETARSHLLSLMIVGVGVLVLIYLRASGHWASAVEQSLGGYSNVLVRSGLPPNMVEGLLIELIALALGVGLLPAIVSLTWYVKRIASPSLDERYVCLTGVGVMLVVFLILTVFSQFGYLGPSTEERYFFYVVPAFWIGTFAALAEGKARPTDFLLCAVGLAAIYGSIPFQSPLTEETAFLAPAESIAQYVLATHVDQLVPGLTVPDALAVLALLAGVLIALVWNRGRTTRLAWIVGISVSAQLLMMGYAYSVIMGDITGIPGRTGSDVSSLGWVDNNTRTGHVVWLDNISTFASPSITGQDQERTTLFWNKTLTSWLALPQTGLPIPTFPMSALPGSDAAHVSTTSGQLGPPSEVAGVYEAVGEVASPFVQLKGRIVAHAPGGGLTMTELSAPVRASWLAVGLQPNGWLVAGPPVHLFAFLTPFARPRLLHLTFVFAAPAPPTGTPAAGHTVLTVRFGSVKRAVQLPVGLFTPSKVALTLCAPAGRLVVPGTLSATRTIAVAGTNLGGALEHVLESSATVSRCPR